MRREEALVPSVPRDDRPFRPHATLARVKQGDPPPGCIRSIPPGYPGACTVSGFLLKKSTLTPAGPIYETLRGPGIKVEKPDRGVGAVGNKAGPCREGSHRTTRTDHGRRGRRGIAAESMIVGSPARGTFIHGDRDLDIFLLFDPSLPGGAVRSGALLRAEHCRGSG